MKKKRQILFVLFVLIAAVAIGYLVYYFVDRSMRHDIYETLQEEVVATVTPTPSPTATPKPEATVTATPIPTPTPSVTPTTIDFNALWAVNPEVAAWIQVPGTVINYPIMRSETDDTYYLNHTIEGAGGYPGSIYMERTNAGAFTDYNTVLYGHNMNSGTMFAGLHAYASADFLSKNHQVIIDTPEQKLTYEIFAAVTFGNEHILNSYDFSTPEGRQVYLDAVMNAGGVYRSDVTVDANSQILTLSTCIDGQPENRFLVEAVLVHE
ncbi:MAG: class B sortase [Bacteroidia bacterium]|nr:class B sortase [Lachnospiraceae bacterium]NCC11081.1 class B sortase [Bacteroidia bacterium]